MSMIIFRVKQKIMSCQFHDTYVTMSPNAVKVGKLKIANLNLKKKIISIRKVITEHGHKILHKNLKAEIIKT